MIPSFLSLMSSANFKGIPPSVFTASLLNAAMLQLPSVVAKRGDHKLAPARDLARIRDGSRREFQFVYDSLRFIADIKRKIMHIVETLYEFDTSQAPESIGRNASDSIKPCPCVANQDEIRLPSMSLSPRFIAN